MSYGHFDDKRREYVIQVVLSLKTIEVTASGATVEEARQSAVEQLNAPEEAEVKIEIISEGKNKILGLFGGSPAEVKAYYEVEGDGFDKARNYIDVILKNLGINESEINFNIEGEDLRINISCQEDGIHSDNSEKFANFFGNFFAHCFCRVSRCSFRYDEQ